MDRNRCKPNAAITPKVALHRSAWIEIAIIFCLSTSTTVALHRSAWIEIRLGIFNFGVFDGRTPQECVDRNRRQSKSANHKAEVALHRSAWIEMCLHFLENGRLRRTPQECVDRN